MFIDQNKMPSRFILFPVGQKEFYGVDGQSTLRKFMHQNWHTQQDHQLCEYSKSNVKSTGMRQS